MQAFAMASDEALDYWNHYIASGAHPQYQPRAREHVDGKSSPDFLPALQKELLDVISKYVKIAPEDIKVQLERQDNLEILEVNIVLNETSPPLPQ